MVENLFEKKSPLQNLLLSLNAVISTNESTQIITAHVIYNPPYMYLQLQTENHHNLALRVGLSQRLLDGTE